jgi:hypothetical protein
MMINRSGIPRGITQCHSGGTALQNQNWSQKKFHFFPPHVFVTCGWPCTTKPVIHNGRTSPYRPDRAILFFVVPVYFVSDLRDGVGARGFL